MILKVPSNDGSWYIIGDIDSIRHYNSDCKVSDDESGDEFIDAMAPIGGVKSREHTIIIRAKKLNGKIVRIKSDFAVYLCNNEGKTIEKL